MNETIRLASRAIADLAVKNRAERSIEEAKVDLENRNEPITQYPATATEDSRFGVLFSQLQQVIDDEDWQQASTVIGQLLARANQLGLPGDATRKLNLLRETLANLALESGTLLRLQQKEAKTIPEIARVIAYKVTPEELREVLASTTVRPYFETMKEALPFLISLDGGLVYAFEFEAIIPAVAVNIKLNRIDFDDPLVTRPELSILVGLGLSAPDDLDPEYRGIFSGSDKSLLISFGARFPAISRLLRFQAGALLYRQESTNPLVDDLDTRASFILGASLNWDALDFAAKLLTGRPTLNIGGA